MMKQITSSLLKTDITAVQIKQNYIFVGSGSYLFIIKSNCTEIIETIKVFQKEVIFNIEFSTGNKFLISGSNAVAIFSFDFTNGACTRILPNYYCSDWILTCKWFNEDAEISTVFMHNNIALWNHKFEKIDSSECAEKCILYSAHLVHKNWKESIVLSGTVFSEILIWSPYKFNKHGLCPVLARLKGHQGVIFSIDYNSSSGLICSTSDDRSSKIWQAEELEFNKDFISNENVHLKFTLYGHSSRIFRCKILKEYIITAGEDAVLNIWNLCGEKMKKINLQNGNCLWTLACDESENRVIVGGSDGALTLFSLDSNKNSDGLLLITYDKQNLPKKINVMKSNNLVVFFEDGKLFYFDVKENKWNLIKNHVDLKKYVVMEISKCRTFLSLSGYNGNVHVYKETQNNDLEYLFYHELPDLGRIFSFHWLLCDYFTCCSSNGTLSLWKIDKNEINMESVLKLPKTRERWTTCAIFTDQNRLIVGDRNGNIYMFNLDEFHPLKTIKKAHTHLGITHLSFQNLQVISLGGNGVIRTYDNQLSTISKDKLPLSWLEKIIENNLILSFHGDVFLVWDQCFRRTVMEVKCGGRHRSWDFKITEDTFAFYYVKDNSIFVKKTLIFAAKPLQIFDYFHTNVVNACKSIRFDDDFIVLLTGGEDTTLRLSVFNSERRFETINVFKSHLSSIRCIDSIKIRKEDFLIFSAGGRAQLISWNVKFSSYGKIDCRQVNSYYEPSENNSEIRVMDLCALKRDNDSIYVIAACSDGNLLIFDRFLKLLKTARRPLAKCMTRLTYLRVSKEKEVIMGCLTNGQVIFIDLIDLLNVNNSIMDYVPFETLELHQSAINSLSFFKLNQDFILATGGDDNKLNVALLRFQDEKIDILDTANDFSCHCAQITGLYVRENYIFSTSIDQKFIIYKYTIDATNKRISLDILRSFYTSVPDVQGFEIFEKDDTFYTFCYGRGMQLLEIKRN